MKQHNGNSTLFLVALAIIGIILFVASRTYNLDYTDSLEFIFLGIGMTVVSSGSKMLSTARKLGYMDYRPETTEIYQELLDYIGYSPEVFQGDCRSDHFKGMLTISPEYIALYHLTEHRVINKLSYTQNIALLKMIADTVYQSQIRASEVKGRHHGLFANVTLQCLARAYHCKALREYHHLTNSHGSALIKVVTKSSTLYYTIDSFGSITNYVR